MSEGNDLLAKLQASVIESQTVYSSWSHWHYDNEMLFVFSGTITVEVENQQYTVQAGQGLHIGGGMIHLYQPNKTQARAVVLKFTLEMLSAVFSVQELTALYSRSFMILPDRYMLTLAAKIASVPYDYCRQYSLFASLVELTARLMVFPGRQIKEQVMQMGGNMRYLQAIQKYLANHEGSVVTLQIVASHLGITANYCSKYIRKCTGMTFIDYLNRFRISTAERLLAFSNFSVTDIAFASGFGSIQTFNRVFKKIVGISPSAFQKSITAQKKAQIE